MYVKITLYFFLSMYSKYSTSTSWVTWIYFSYVETASLKVEDPKQPRCKIDCLQQGMQT